MASGNIHIRGSHLTAGGDIDIHADQNLELHASQDWHSQSNRSSFGSASIGITYGGGSQNGLSINIGASTARSRGQGSGTGYSPSTVVAAENARISSGADTTLRGAGVHGQRIESYTGGNLTIESLQDSNRYSESSSNSGFSLSLCIPPICYGMPVSGSISAGKSKIRSNYQSVGSQSGLYAGAAGFNVYTEGHTSLIGGVIAGNREAAEQGKNRFSTASLSTQDINIIGGTADASRTLIAEAGRDLTISTTTSSSQGGTAAHGYSHTVIDRVAGLYVTGQDSQGLLLASAGNNLSMAAAAIGNAAPDGLTVLQADKNISLGTVDTGRQQNIHFDSRNHLNWGNTQEIGSRLTGAGDITVAAGHNLRVKASDIDATGHLQLQAGRDITVEAGTATTNLDDAYYRKRSGLFGSSSNTQTNKIDTTQAIGSNIGGRTVTLQGGQDIHISGSNVISDAGTQIQAGQEINIVAAQNTQAEEHYRHSKSSGLMGTGGAGIFIGTKKESTESDAQTTTHSGSLVGSLTGDTTIVAGERYRQIGSDVLAPDGDIVIAGKKLDIDAAQNTYASDYRYTFEQKGLTIALSAPVINAAQGLVDAADKVGQSKSDRANAMAIANAAWSGRQAAQAISQSAASQNPAGGISISITYGQQKNTQTQHSNSTQTQGSQINAGGNATLIASGGGQDSTLTIRGSDAAGLGGTHLVADNRIELLAAQQTASERSQNKSSGFNAGVAIELGQGGASFGITAGANYGKGHANSDETTWRHTHVGSSQSQTTLQSAGDTTLKGAQVAGKGIKADIGGDLTIASLQDTATYDSKQQNISGQVTIGYGVSASGNYSQSKLKADHASVTEQSGLYAGDDGYHITVEQHTDLKGGLITSSQKAQDAGKNSFSTASLTHSAINNHSWHEGESFGIGGGISFNADLGLGKNAAAQSSAVQTDAQGQPITDAQGHTIPASGLDSVQANKAIGYGEDSASQSSTTASGINTANIRITDEAAQQQRSGHNAQETIAAIQTKLSTATAAQHAAALTNTFNAEDIQKELDLQREITQQFDRNRQAARAEITAQEKELRDQANALEKAARQAQAEGDMERAQTLMSQSTQASQQANRWQSGGLILNSLAGALYGPNSNGATGAIAQAASPFVAQQIGEYFKQSGAENSAGHIVAHTILGAAVAAASGSNALSGGLAAGGAEAAAPALAQWLYNESDPSKLSAQQKSTISAITGLAGAGMGAAAGGSAQGTSAANAAAASQAAQNAVENNWGDFGHYSTMAAVLRFAGYSSKEAQAIALAATAPDKDGRSATTTENIALGIHGPQASIHALDGVQDLEQVLQQQQELSKQAAEVFKFLDTLKGDPEKFAAALTNPSIQNVLHKWGDVYGHVTQDGKHYSAGLGHTKDSVPFSYNPDNSFCNTDRYVQYVMDIYSVASQYRTPVIGEEAVRQIAIEASQNRDDSDKIIELQNTVQRRTGDNIRLSFDLPLIWGTYNSDSHNNVNQRINNILKR